MEFFGIDMRFKDETDRVSVIHYARTLEDESIIVLHTFKPYIIITHPFLRPYEELRDITLDMWTQRSTEQIYLERATYSPKECSIARFDTIAAYLAFREMIREHPAHFLEIASRMSLKKRYLLEHDLIPLTVWDADMVPVPYNARVKAYQAVTISQNDSLAYTNPALVSMSILTESFLDKLLLSNEAITAALFSTSSGTRAITWKQTRTFPCSVEHVPSEIDLLDRWKRSFAQERASIVAGYDSDTIDLSRLMLRAEKYQSTTRSASLTLSDDFREPYRSRTGIHIHGIVHLDMKIVLANLSVLDTYKEIADLIDDLNVKVASGIFETNTPARAEVEHVKLLRSSAQRVYPVLLELAKLCREPLFEISRMSPYEAFQSYYETQCILASRAPEEYAFDNEPYQSREDIVRFTGTSTDATHAISIHFLAALIALNDQITKQTYRCGCCDPGDTREWYCQKEQSALRSHLESLLVRYTTYHEAIERTTPNPTDPIVAKKDAIDYLIIGFEHAYKTRSSTLYFPQGVGTLHRIMKSLLESIPDTIAATPRIIYSDKDVSPDVRERIATRLPYAHDYLSAIIMPRELRASYLIRLDNGRLAAATLDTEHTLRATGLPSRTSNLCAYALFLRDMVLRKILEGASKQELIAYYRDKVDAFAHAPISEAIIITTLSRDLDA